MKSWGSLSRHGTAGGGRGPARPTRRMPRLHSLRAPGRMSEFAAGEPVRSAEQPEQPAEQRAQASELPVPPTEPPTQSSAVGAGIGAAATLHDLRLPGGQAGGHGGTGPRLLGRRHASVLGERRGSGGCRILDGILSRSDRCSRDPTPPAGRTESLPVAVRRVTFSTGMYISCLAVLILSLGTLALSPFLGDSLRIIGADSTTAAFFVIGSVATMGALTFDNAAIGLHRGSAQLWRGSLNSVLKLAIVGVLVLVGTRTAPGLLFAWALALVVSLVLYPHASTRTDPGRRREPQPSGGTRPPLRRALPQAPRPQSVDQFHLLRRCADCSSPDPPQQLAYFSTALLLSSTVMIIPYLLALSLFAEISGDQSLLHRHVRRTLPLGLALSGGIVVVAEVAAPLVLRIFGPAYAMNGTTALRLLLLVGPAYVIKDHYVAIRRAQGRLGHAAKMMAAGTCAEAAGAALGGIYWGMTGLCIGWAIGAWCEAVVLLPAVIRVFHRDPPAEPHAGGSSQ